MWGTRRLRHCTGQVGRFTPTHVGNTRGLFCSQSQRSGSPPRMWGTLRHLTPCPTYSRFTPTHVGNTCWTMPTGNNCSVHPHACGEHLCSASAGRRDCGSPPRMWGTHAARHSRAPRKRFTPTHVGNTKHQNYLPPLYTVHPHACGEHLAADEVSPLKDGSPPRMWGTPPDGQIKGCIGRFTPTHVGNTRADCQVCRQPAVHPHACGEHTHKWYDWISSDGSPPRMWGTHQHRSCCQDYQRFTPTHVGNTNRICSSVRC